MERMHKYLNQLGASSVNVEKKSEFNRLLGIVEMNKEANSPPIKQRGRKRTLKSQSAQDEATRTNLVMESICYEQLTRLDKILDVVRREAVVSLLTS